MKKSLIVLFILIILYVPQTIFFQRIIYPISYNELIKQYSLQYQIDPYLVLAIIQAESNFKSNSVSAKGALGLMQIMPATANWIIQKNGYPLITLEFMNEPEVNLALGTWYINQLLTCFEGNEVETIAAYNAGPGKVEEWLENKVWDGKIETLRNIPYTETKEYVKRVLYYRDKFRLLYPSEFKS